MVILVILSILIGVVPSVFIDTTSDVSLEKSVPAFFVLIAVHLVLLAVLIRKIRVSCQDGLLRKTRLIISGITLILMSMFLIDRAGALMEYPSDMSGEAIIVFICAVCDMIAGIITIMLPTRLPDNRRGT